MENTITYIKLTQLTPHKDNPRKDLGDLSELSESIKVNGIMQNLTVVQDPANEGFYTIIIGHRRAEAAKLAGLTEVPCVIAKITPQQQREIMLIENMNRADLTVYEQAKGMRQLQIDFGLMPEEIAKRTGFSEVTVRKRIKWAEMDEKELAEAAKKQISFGDLDKLGKIKDIDTRNQVLKTIGTKDFDAAVKKAVDKQAFEEKLKELFSFIAGCKNLAKIEEVDYSTHDYYFDVSSWRYDFDFKEKLNDDTKRVYKISDSGDRVTFYTIKIKEEKEETEGERIARLKKEELEQIRSELKALEKLYAELQNDFLKSYSFKKEHKSAVHEFCAHVIPKHGGAYYMGVVNNLIGLDPDDCKPGEYEKKFAENFEKNLLLYSYGIYFSSHTNAFHSETWDSKKRTYIWEYDLSEKMDEKYKLLERLGYLMSEEEEQLYNGTHPIFAKLNQKEEAEESVAAS